MKPSRKAIEAMVAISELNDIFDMKAVNAAYREQWARLQARTRASFAVGDRVTFRSRSGVVVNGVVIKVMVKNIMIQQDDIFNTRWRVTPTTLTKVS